MKMKTVIFVIISALAVQQASFASETGKRNTAATLGALFGAVVGAVGASAVSKKQDNAQAIADVPKVSQKSVNKLVRALQGREFKCRTEDFGVISIYFEHGTGLILAGEEEKTATTNASLTDGKYRWYTPQYDKEYTAINSGSILTSETDGKVYRGPAIAVNSGNEVTYLKCTKVIANTLFDPFPTKDVAEAPSENQPKKEKSGLSNLWKSVKDSTKNGDSNKEMAD